MGRAVQSKENQIQRDSSQKRERKANAAIKTKKAEELDGKAKKIAIEIDAGT